MLLSDLLSTLPAGLKEPLLHCYNEIISNYAEHRWEPSELNGGKFCEVVYTILSGYLNGTFPAKPSKPKSMVDACLALERLPANSSLAGDRSVRVLIPRVLPYLYEIRNNRGVGHVGGDVDPNFLDASAVVSTSSWILAELVRIFHGVSTAEAQEIVDAVVERKHPIVWEVGNMRRVLMPSLKISDQVLMLLYTRFAWVKDSDLFKWVEYSTMSMFRQRILIPLHKARLIEYDKEKGLSRISPLGALEVEKKIVKG